MLGQLAREDETHGRLDLPTGDGRPLVVMLKLNTQNLDT